MPTVEYARNMIATQIVSGPDGSITPGKLRQVLLDVIDSLSTLEGPGFTYTWSTTTTSGDPGSGVLRGNHATLGSISALYMSETAIEGNIQGYLAAIFGGDSAAKAVMIIADVDDHDNYIAATVTSDTDSGSYRTLAVTVTSSGGALANGATVVVQISPVGGQGEPVIPTRLGETHAAIGDLNSVVQTGFYYFSTTTSNRPSGSSYGHVICLMGNDATFGRQIAIDWSADAMYVRARASSVWGSWARARLTEAEQDARYAKISGASFSGPVYAPNLSGATTVSGPGDWNDAANTLAGFAPELLLGSGTNGPGPATYFHCWNIHYSGQITQIAVPYAAYTSTSALYIRGRYQGTWSAWVLIHGPSVASVVQIRSNTANLLLDTTGAWGAATFVALTDAATISVDMSTFLNASVTLAGNRTLGSPTNEKVGQSGVIFITQDATGGRTLAYGSDWKFAGGTAPVLSTAANAVDALFYTVRATNFIVASLVKDVK